MFCQKRQKKNSHGILKHVTRMKKQSFSTCSTRIKRRRNWRSWKWETLATTCTMLMFWGKRKAHWLFATGHLKKIPETLKTMCLVQNVLGISRGLFCISMVVQSVLSCPEKREPKRWTKENCYCLRLAWRVRALPSQPSCSHLGASRDATGTSHQDTRDAPGQDAGEAVELQEAVHRTHHTSSATSAGPETSE